MRIYVAASSQELVRATLGMNLVRASGGIVARDWTEDVRSYQQGKPVNLQEVMRGNAEAIARADLLWYLSGKASTGAGFEAGVASGLGIPIIVSGQGHTMPDLLCKAFSNDHDAWLYIRNVLAHDRNELLSCRSLFRAGQAPWLLPPP